MRRAVRFIQADAVRQQLEQQHVVLLSSLAYSAAGEVRACSGSLVPSLHPKLMHAVLPAQELHNFTKHSFVVAERTQGGLRPSHAEDRHCCASAPLLCVRMRPAACVQHSVRGHQRMTTDLVRRC